MFCRSCSSWVAEGNLYCTFCGALTKEQGASFPLFWILEVALVIVLAFAFYLGPKIGMWR